MVFGSLFGRRGQDLEGYTVGGRNLPWWALLLSIVATETSTVTFLSIPGFAYRHDLTWLQLPMGYMVGRLLVVFLLLPHFFRGHMLTAYEVLHRRFGGSVKTAASAMFLVTRTLADGLRLFLGAIVLQKVSDIDLVLAIHVPWRHEGRGLDRLCPVPGLHGGRSHRVLRDPGEGARRLGWGLRDSQ